MSGGGAPTEFVAFDLDGTLVDSRRDLAAAVNHARMVLDLAPLSEASVLGFVGDGVEALVRRAFPGVEDEALTRARAAFDAHYAAHGTEATTLYPGITTLLDQLADRRLAVVTNKSDRFVVPLLEAVGILDRFERVLGARDDLAKKPSPAMLQHLLDGMAVPPGRAWFVGDGPQDVGAGRAAGVRVCAVTWGYGDPTELRGLGPDAVAVRPKEVARAIG